MIKISDKGLTKVELLKRCGRVEQVAGYKRYKFTDGRAKELEVVEINNGTGLKFTILLDKALDIAACDYKGINISYLSSNSLVSPSLSVNHEREWLKSFPGGLLSTCGLTTAGADSVENNNKYPLHGGIGICPADNITCRAYWDKDDYYIEVSGKSYETQLFGNNLTLTRKIIVKAGENRINIYDEIENVGFRPSPLMLIYHMNFGYPLLDQGAEIVVDSENKSNKNVSEPIANIKEEVFFHDKLTNDNGFAKASILNIKLNNNGLGVEIKFSLENLPYLNQWNMFGEGEYVLGLEPSNCSTKGRATEAYNNTLRYINPGEIKKNTIIIDIIENLECL